jgi:glucose-6-phosphate 1-dehydrogenase
MGAMTLVILGASGDLTQRLLMPALYRLHTLGLTRDLRIVGYAKERWNREHFEKHIQKALHAFSPYYKTADWNRFRHQLDYIGGELEPDQLSQLKSKLAPATLFYLALPPQLFGVAAKALGEAGFAKSPRNGWRRLVVEKPFGTDLASAQALRQEMHAYWEEEQIMRIDHFLGKETTQNLIVFRMANRFIEPVWNAQHIAQVQITFAETLGVEKRAAYYDKAGALRDMLQNHLMQLFSLTAIAPLAEVNAEMLRDHKVEVLRSVVPITAKTVDQHAVRGQYRAGKLGRKKLVAYRSEPGIKRGSDTETFAALRLEVDNWRWRGVPFYLRSGKRIASNYSEIAVQFREVPGPIPHAVHAGNNWMIFRIRPVERMDLLVTAKQPGVKLAGRPATLTALYANPDDREFSAYEQLLMDALGGDRSNFLRFDEVEWAWKVLTPVLKAWEKGTPDFYAAGSEGPHTQERLLDPDHHWRSIALDGGDET